MRKMLLQILFLVAVDMRRSGSLSQEREGASVDVQGEQGQPQTPVFGVAAVIWLCYGFWMALCGGTLYAFPAMSMEIKERLHLGAEEVAYIYAAGGVGNGCAILSGFIFDDYGYKACCLFAAGLFFSGGVAFWYGLIFELPGSASMVCLILSMGISQLGSSALYQTALFVNMRRAHGAAVGRCAGTLAGGFGLSAALWTNVYGTFFRGSSAEYFLTTGFIFGITSLLAIMFFSFRHNEIEGEASTKGIKVLPIGGAGADNDTSPDGVAQIQDQTLSDILRAREFQLTLFTFMLMQGVGSGIFIQELGLMGKSLGHTPTMITHTVVMVSLCNSMGRLLSGWAQDRGLERWRLPRSSHFLLSSTTLLVTCLALVIFPQWLTSPWRARLPLASVALAYGSNWAVLPASLVDRFGHRHVGMSYNVCSSLLAVAAAALSVLAGQLYDASALREASQAPVKAEEDVICTGTTCFRGTWAMALIVSTFAWVGAVALHRMASSVARADGHKGPVST